MISEETRNGVRRFCRLYIEGLRKILKANPPKESPCHSCAFAPKTDSWQGFESTIWHLIQAATGEKPFYCHRNMPRVNGNYKPDPAKMIPCANYEAIRNRPDELDRVLREAAVDSHLEA
jgi:hypothetical protein